MNIDDLKKSWNDINVNDDRLDGGRRRLSAPGSYMKMKSSKDRLHATLLRVSAVCFTSIGFVSCLNHVGHMFPVGMLAAMVVYFVIMGVLNIVMAGRLSAIDLASVTVAEALRLTLRFRVLRQRCKIVGWTLCVMLLVPMFYYFAEMDDIYILYGAVAGLVVGLAIGLWIDRGMRRLIKDMISDLEDNGDDE